MIGQFFYTLIISPLVQIIEVCYLVTFRIFHNSGLALCAVSLAVSALTLPLYFMAEKWQRLERDTQKALAPKITKIKSVFKGDEQYLILSTLYRQNHYHPLYALRSSIGLLIQVPFFIAAYSYLSRLDALNGASFAFIRNLGAPDAAFTVPLGNGTFPVNLLPIAMTAVNIAAGAIYTKGFAVKEKVQLFAMAALFLVLLYDSPAGLVLYWTLNNVFSLVKNCLQKTKHAPRLIYGVAVIAVAALDIFLLFFHPGDLPNRLLVMAVITVLLAAPLLRRVPLKIRQEIPQSTTPPQSFSLSCLILFVLAGLVIPATLVASDVAEFSFLEHSPSPVSFVAYTLLQSAGFFLVWPLCLYLLFPGKTRRVFTVAALALAFFALINVFLPDLLSPEAGFGFLTNTLIFSDPKTVSSLGISVLVNIGLLALGAIALWFAGRKKRLLMSLQTIALIALTAFGIANLPPAAVFCRFAVENQLPWS
ncbi:hypothetical protein FACS1894109_04280 [Spirochaetia bacterium]|nr:hypothetical protein FACS1894109_04280 [Spirochaetia bacterium]